MKKPIRSGLHHCRPVVVLAMADAFQVSREFDEATSAEALLAAVYVVLDEARQRGLDVTALCRVLRREWPNYLKGCDAANALDTDRETVFMDTLLRRWLAEGGFDLN